MSNLKNIKNYQLTGTNARKVHAAFETIATTYKLLESMVSKISYTLMVQKYPEINESLKSIEELTKLSNEAPSIVEKLVCLMAISTKSTEKLKDSKLNHGKSKEVIKKEIQELEASYYQVYLKLMTYDVELTEQIEQESYKLLDKAAKLRKEIGALEEEVLKIASSAFSLDLESMTITEMDLLLANLEKENIWGFDFFTKRLEATNQSLKLAKNKRV